jgi:tryptophan synthase beta chain
MPKKASPRRSPRKAKKTSVVNLRFNDIPTQWYNILPDLPVPLPPPQDPQEGPSRLQNLPNLMIGECLKQEFSTERWIDIPGGVMDLYAKAGRPRPLFRATNLEKRLGTPARLYYKGEFMSPTGSHKVNTALAQCWYAKRQGFERVTTETGAGQWGTALAYAAAVTGLKCTVFWVRSVFNWKKDRLSFMKLLGADVHASPSPITEVGKALYDQNPEHVGSLGIAISEGLEDSQKDPKATYCLGSVLNHVLMHQSIIGLEAKKQFALFDDYPDIVISCLGGGSNFGGFALPFVADVLKKGKKIKFIASQSEVAPNLQGKYEYDFADYAEITPMLKMYTLGHKTDMEPVKGDGLRYHGCSPILSLLRNKGYIDTIAYPKDEKHVFEAAKMFMEAEGWLPAPSAIRSAVPSTRHQMPKSGKEKTIFNISSHGFLDISGYQVWVGITSF